MTASRWLAGPDWANAQHHGTTSSGGGLKLAATPTGGFVGHGVAVVPASRPAPAQVDSAGSDRWRRVVLRLAGPVPATAWVRLWTRIEAGAGVPEPPGRNTDLPEDAPTDTPAGVWRAAPSGAIDARILCREDGDLWVALELGSHGEATAEVTDVFVESGDAGPVTALPVAYRELPDPTEPGADDGDGVLGRYLGLLGAQLDQTTSVLDELPALLSPAVAPDRADAPWLERLAEWVALDPELLPADDAARREAVATAVARHGRRGTRNGLIDEVRRLTGVTVEVYEPLLDAVVWQLDGGLGTSSLGLTTGLLEADPGPPALDSTALLDAAMLIDESSAGLPVHARRAHRICVHVPDASPDELAAVAVIVERERPAHVLARTRQSRPVAGLPTVVGVDTIPAPSPGLADDISHRRDSDGPGARLGTARLPADPEPNEPKGEAQ
jgi:phage tail-like protein